MNKNDPRKAPEHKALGKGLNALLPSRGNAPVMAAVAAAVAPGIQANGSVFQAPIAQVRPKRRTSHGREFDEQAMLGPAQSVEREGDHPAV